MRRSCWRNLGSIGAAGRGGTWAPRHRRARRRDRNRGVDCSAIFSVMTSGLLGGVSADIRSSVDRMRGRSGQDECGTTWSRESCYARMIVRIELELWTPGREPELILYRLDCDRIYMRFDCRLCMLWVLNYLFILVVIVVLFGTPGFECWLDFKA